METMFRGTTICAVKRNGKIAVAGDGQVTLQNSIIFKNNARKVRRIYNNRLETELFQYFRLIKKGIQ